MITLLVALAPAAPVPKHLFVKKPAYYFPTAPGTTWVYDDGTSEETHMITKVESVQEGEQITVENVHPQGRTPYGILIVSADRVLQSHYQGKKLDKPLLWLKTPPRPGDAWTWTFIAGQVGTDTVDKLERLEVPAGTFEATKVDSVYGIGAANQNSSHWYAEGVGLVQSSFAGGGKKVLKSFTLGKD
jgi:hypothetical protein